MSEGAALAGKVVVVTGGGRGIGAACAVLLARRGARVALAARTANEVARVAGTIGDEGGQALPVACDVTREEAVSRLFAEVDERLGPLDVLVHAAGQAAAAPLLELPPAEWERLWRVNVAGTLLCARAALERMRPRRAGLIVSFGDATGRLPGSARPAGLGVYAATKGAVVALCEALALEAAPEGVRVACVSPGPVNTTLFTGAGLPPPARTMTKGEVAEVVAFLAGEGGAAVHGSEVVVRGRPEAPPAG